MKILQLNNEDERTELNNSMKAKKQVFLLIYMEGCGPCNDTRPEWKKIENPLNENKNGKYNNVVVAEIDKDNLKKLAFIKDDLKGYPSIKYISNNGSVQEDFEDSNIKNKTRTIDSFIEWIELKSGKQNGGTSKYNIKTRKNKIRNGSRKNKKGGKWSLKYKRSINCRSPKGFSQKQHCKYGRT
jgi:thiol-disulfide isomerase/thioredoxin